MKKTTASHHWRRLCPQPLTSDGSRLITRCNHEEADTLRPGITGTARSWFRQLTLMSSCWVYQWHREFSLNVNWLTFGARFVILLYDRTSICVDINKARQRTISMEQQCPANSANHARSTSQAAYQLEGHMWPALLAAPNLPLPTRWWWSENEDRMYHPHCTRLPHAADTCHELVSCKCKKGCVKRCQCKKTALKCTALCACGGEFNIQL